MDLVLNDVETRILGALIEKEITTPEYYPLTLNALTNACNQKNNRDPIVSFDETTVARGIESLREKKLVITITGAGMRVPKYKHLLPERYPLTHPEVTILCLLLLRGAQTVGELRNRSGAMHPFQSLEEVQQTLTCLSTANERPAFVLLLPRQPGQKEQRFTHLFSGEPTSIAPLPNKTRPEQATLQVRAENERITALEEAVADLKASLEDLQKQFAQFKKQFE